MFDFGADARAEGGENGQNHKGLMTMDRKYKKDSFYAYKAWLSDEKFVHICGKRYVERVEDVTKVTVYSNMPEVELFANGISLGKQTSDVHFFYFDVPNVDTTHLKAVAGEYTDESEIKKVEVFNEKYRLVEQNAILNWFEVDMPAGRLSLNDKMGEVLATFRGKLIFLALMRRFMPKRKKGEPRKAMGFELSADMMQMMNGFTVLRLCGMLGMMNISFTKEELLNLNKKLNKIRKKKKVNKN
jgi:beta-galactosidase